MCKALACLPETVAMLCLGHLKVKHSGPVL